MYNNLITKPRLLPNRAKKIRALNIGEAYIEPVTLLRNNYAICATTVSYIKKKLPEREYQTEKRHDGIYVHRIK